MVTCTGGDRGDPPSGARWARGRMDLPRLWPALRSGRAVARLRARSVARGVLLDRARPRAPGVRRRDEPRDHRGPRACGCRVGRDLPQEPAQVRRAAERAQPTGLCPRLAEIVNRLSLLPTTGPRTMTAEGINSWRTKETFR